MRLKLTKQFQPFFGPSKNSVISRLNQPLQGDYFDYRQSEMNADYSSGFSFALARALMALSNFWNLPFFRWTTTLVFWFSLIFIIASSPSTFVL